MDFLMVAIFVNLIRNTIGAIWRNIESKVNDLGYNRYQRV